MTELPKTEPEIDALLAQRAAKTRYMLSDPIPVWPELASTLLAFLSIVLLVDAPKDNQLIRGVAYGALMVAAGWLWKTINKLRQKVEALSRLATNSEQEASAQQKRSNALN